VSVAGGGVSPPMMHVANAAAAAAAAVEGLHIASLTHYFLDEQSM